MTTQEKLARYENAVKEWSWKIKAWKTGDLLDVKPIQPSPSTFLLLTPTETWAAARILSKLTSSEAVAALP